MESRRLPIGGKLLGLHVRPDGVITPKADRRHKLWFGVDFLSQRRVTTGEDLPRIIIAHFTENWGFYTLLTCLPMFLRDVLGYSLDTAGFLASFP